MKGTGDIYYKNKKIASNEVLTYLQNLKAYHIEERVDLCAVVLSSRTTNNVVALRKNYFSSAHGDITSVLLCCSWQKKRYFYLSFPELL